MTALLIAALVIPWLFVAVLTRLVFQLLQQHGKQVIASEELRASEAAKEKAPLALTARAPDFKLKDLEGTERTLEDFLGQPLLVTFFNTTCSFCLGMAPQLGKLPESSPRVLLVGNGDPEEYRKLAAEHGWSFDVVLDDNWATATAYKSSGTPSAYLLTADGLISSELALGAERVLGLATPAPIGSNGSSDSSASSGHGLSVRDVSESRLRRNGLDVGTEAPDFTLPNLSGGEQSLSDFRGKRTLLVFSDTNCGPCDAVAPKLVKLAKKHRDDLEIVMVSRGEADANAAKAAEHGYTFPVLLQSSWEISKLYAIFSTPVGYLIDEDGVITHEVAVGGDAIMGLV